MQSDIKEFSSVALLYEQHPAGGVEGPLIALGAQLPSSRATNAGRSIRVTRLIIDFRQQE